MYKIGIIHNPNAKRNKLTDKYSADVLTEILRKHKTDGLVVTTKDHKDSLERAVETFKREGVNLVLVNGGDGTHVHVFTKFIKAYEEPPVFCSLNGGTMNNISYAWGLRGMAPTDILEKVCSAEHLEYGHQHLIRVKTPDEWYGQVFAVSPAASKFLDEYYSAEVPGKMDVAKIIGKVLLSAALRTDYHKQFVKTLDAKVEADGKELECPRCGDCDDYMLVIASTVPRIAEHLNLFYRLDDPENRGKMHVIAPHHGVTENIANILRYAGVGILNGLKKDYGLDCRRTFDMLKPKEGIYDDVNSNVVVETSEPQKVVLDSETICEATRMELDSRTSVRMLVLRD